MSTKEARLRAQKKYDAAHKDDFKNVFLKLHREKDRDVIDKLSRVPNMQGYIKELIRADISS